MTVLSVGGTVLSVVSVGGTVLSVVSVGGTVLSVRPAEYVRVTAWCAWEDCENMHNYGVSEPAMLTLLRVNDCKLRVLVYSI